MMEEERIRIPILSENIVCTIYFENLHQTRTSRRNRYFGYLDINMYIEGQKHIHH
jgi:hypothetical protein